MSPLLFASASTMSLPLCSTVFLISIPWFAKKPFWMPRSSGNPLAIGNVSSVTVASVLPGELAAEPPNSNTDASADTIATANPLRFMPLLLTRCSYRNRQLALDQPVDVSAQVHELG